MCAYKEEKSCDMYWEVLEDTGTYVGYVPKGCEVEVMVAEVMFAERGNV